MAKSILVDNMDYCLFCGSPTVEIHHIFFGADRPVADKHGLVVPLCNKHHTGSSDCPHRNRIIDLSLKYWGQTVYELKIGDRNDFRREFRKSYL